MKFTTEKDGWPDDKFPSELYLRVYRGKEIARLVILKEGVYIDVDICLKTSDEIVQWAGIIKIAWQMKIKQDRKGWRERT